MVEHQDFKPSKIQIQHSGIHKTISCLLSTELTLFRHVWNGISGTQGGVTRLATWLEITCGNPKKQCLLVLGDMVGISCPPPPPTLTHLRNLLLEDVLEGNILKSGNQYSQLNTKFQVNLPFKINQTFAIGEMPQSFFFFFLYKNN